jgi:hypothetical protein
MEALCPFSEFTRENVPVHGNTFDDRTTLAALAESGDQAVDIDG